MFPLSDCTDAQQAPKELDARLEALGGQRLAPIFLDDFGLFKEVHFSLALSIFLKVFGLFHAVLIILA